MKRACGPTTSSRCTPAPRQTGWRRWSAARCKAALLTQPFDFRAEAQGYRKLLDIGAFGKEYGFLTVLARPQWLRDNPDTARGYLRALAAGVDWLYDPANRDEAIAILARETKLEPAIATQTYNYYVGELQPFSRKLAIPDADHRRARSRR